MGERKGRGREIRSKYIRASIRYRAAGGRGDDVAEGVEAVEGGFLRGGV